MSLFKKKETLVQNITYMAMMAAINVVFVLLTTFVPVLMFLIIFVLPLTSTIVTLYCKKRYFAIYALATIGLCMLVTFWNISDTLFYVIPSIISGFLFGIMIIYKIHSLWIIFSTAVVQLIFSYLMIPVTEWITEVNIVNVFASAFGVSNFVYLDYLVPSFIFFLSLTQSAFSYIVIKEELPKFNYTVVDHHFYLWSSYVGLAASTLMIIIFAFVYCPIAFLFMMGVIYFSMYILIDTIVRGNKVSWTTLPIVGFVSILIFASLYSLIKAPANYLLLSIFFISISLVGFCQDLVNYIQEKKKKNKLIQNNDMPQPNNE